MNISKLASTVILATVFSTIFLFAIIFYLYGGGSDALRDALSMTAGFFGGIATLVAAYIATKLFNDWKEQHNKQILAFEAKKLHLDLSGLMRVIAEFETTKLNINHNYINLSPIHKQFGDLYDAHETLTTPLLDFMDLSRQETIKDLISSTTNHLDQQRTSLALYKKGKEADLIESIENTCYFLRCNNNEIKNLLQSYIFIK